MGKKPPEKKKLTAAEIQSLGGIARNERMAPDERKAFWRGIARLPRKKDDSPESEDAGAPQVVNQLPVAREEPLTAEEMQRMGGIERNARMTENERKAFWRSVAKRPRKKDVPRCACGKVTMKTFKRGQHKCDLPEETTDEG
jgi:hypothetical protein